MKKLILFFAAIVALTSCSITKRHYAPGYHVEWKGMRSQVELPKEPLAERIEKVESNSVVENVQSEVTGTFFAPSVSNFPESSSDIQLGGVETFIEETLEQQSIPVMLDLNYDDERRNAPSNQEIIEAPAMASPPTGDINTMALVGFILSMSSFLLVITGLPGLIVSAIGLKQINDGRGEGKGLAIAGIVVGALYTLLVLLYAVLIALEVFAIY
jgi:hypothetical protein